MSRIRNAQDFGARIADALRQFREARDLLEAQREQYVPPQEGARAAEALEAHGRGFVDVVLESLNWQLNLRATPTTGQTSNSESGGPPTVIREAPVRSSARGSVRFLDYLGVSFDPEDHVVRALMLVETKRPGDRLFAASSGENHSTTLAGALEDPSILAAPWNEWLETARDYVNSVVDRTGGPPRRLVITNGEWWVVFRDPEGAFVSNAPAADAAIDVYESPDDLLRRLGHFFQDHEHSRVLGQVSQASLGELAFVVQGGDVECVCHGLRVRYCPVHELNHASWPVVSVAVVLFVCLRGAGWLVVDGASNHARIPTNEDVQSGRTIGAHLDQVRDLSEHLLQEVNRRLSLSMAAAPIRTGDGVNRPRLVQSLGNDEYLVLTGDQTHFFCRPENSSCGNHSFQAARTAGVASRLQILAPQVEPRALFVDGTVNHCAHREVETAKAEAPRTPDAGREPGLAFCPLWSIEQRLCCRTCVYESVCTTSDLFRLPCERA